jgi:hypothetical protein
MGVMNEQETPILAGMMQWFIDEDIAKFREELTEIASSLENAANPVREKLLQNNEIRQVEYIDTDATVGAIDSATVEIPLGEVFTVVSLATHYDPNCEPKFVANRKTGYNSEAYRHLSVGLRLHGELSLMAEADRITIADNSFWSYLMDTNKLITAYWNLPDNEREPFQELYDEVTKPGQGYFVKAIMNPNIIAMSKTGSSQFTCQRSDFKQFFKTPISDLALFSYILKPGEYTAPRPLKAMTDSSFGVEKRGWSTEEAAKINHRYTHQDELNVLFFKPWSYKKAYRIEFDYRTFGSSDLKTLLTVIREDTKHHTIVEPVSQMYADRLAKQVSAISRMYGAINSPIFSNILFPTRT